LTKIPLEISQLLTIAAPLTLERLSAPITVPAIHVLGVLNPGVRVCVDSVDQRQRRRDPSATVKESQGGDDVGARQTPTTLMRMSDPDFASRRTLVRYFA
jgi:hypothetical protein